MGALWVVAEPGPDGGLARISTEAATLARGLGAAAGRDVVGIVVAADPAAAAADLATYLPLVLAVTDPAAADHAWSAVAAGHVAALAEADAPDAIFVGAGADGRDLAGRRLGADRARRPRQRDRRRPGPMAARPSR